MSDAKTKQKIKFKFSLTFIFDKNSSKMFQKLFFISAVLFIAQCYICFQSQTFFTVFFVFSYYLFFYLISYRFQNQTPTYNKT